MSPNFSLSCYWTIDQWSCLSPATEVGSRSVASELAAAQEQISDLSKQLEFAQVEVASKQEEIETLQMEVQRLKDGGSGELQALEASHKAQMDGLRTEVESRTNVRQKGFLFSSIIPELEIEA